jgi:hypothetical protein
MKVDRQRDDQEIHKAEKKQEIPLGVLEEGVVVDKDPEVVAGPAEQNEGWWQK